MTCNIWPRRLPAQILSDSRKEAEVQVYDRLARGLSDDFHVFYSSPWLGTDRFGNEIDGECDFTIAHRELGLLAIEVKGGGIEYRPETGQWISVDRNKIPHKIKDPVRQAMTAKHALLDKLKAAPRWRTRRISLHHGVIFPHAATPRGDLGADRPARIFCGASEFRKDLAGWVQRRMTSAAPQEPLGTDGLAALEQILARPFTLSFRMSAAVGQDIEDLRLLETQQYQILDYISQIPRAQISGAAGTGKTVLATEEAVRSARAGRRTLLTCYNTVLGSDLRRRTAGEANLISGSFHGICVQLCRAAGIDAESRSSDPEYFATLLPEALMSAAAARPELTFDTVIVDEGQDFSENWWIAIDSLLRQDGLLRVFSDANQKLYGTGQAGLKDLSPVPIPLLRNLRNTGRIHAAASVHYSGPKVMAAGPEGTELVWVETSGPEQCAKAAFDELKRLVFTEEVDPGDIAVLFPDRKMKEAFLELTARTALAFGDGEDTAGEKVVLETVRRFKGLEKPVIILCVTHAGPGLTELAYVGMSRARAALSVVTTRAQRVWLEAGWNGGS